MMETIVKSHDPAQPLFLYMAFQMILFKRLNNTFLINKNLPRMIPEELMPAW